MSCHKTLVKNRKAFHDYEMLEEHETGIVLLGTEVKSLRSGSGSLQQAYVKVIGKQLWLIGASIAPYAFGNVHNHEERQDRKLLMHKGEIKKLKEKVSEKGLSLIPLELYFKKGKVKLLIGLGKGKRQEDKRQTIKQREADVEMKRFLKKYR